MISDTLSDAIAEIDRYLTDPVFAGAYVEADVRAHVQRVREEMESLRVRLDEVPPPGHVALSTGKVGET